MNDWPGNQFYHELCVITFLTNANPSCRWPETKSKFIAWRLDVFSVLH